MSQKLFGRFDIAAEPYKHDGEKVFVYYLGAGFCPWCAAERWSIVEALKQFGVWEGLMTYKSAERNEPYLNLPTYNFHGAQFKSAYVDFVSREFQDRNFQDLDRLTAEDNTIIDNYNLQGVIPFIFIAGRYIRIGSGPKPQQLNGLSYEDVIRQLQTKDTELANAIYDEANHIAALIYHSTGGRANVSEDVKVIAAQIR
ncbi:MAG: DUF929 family protein [Nitrososphaerales archaeon]